MPGVDTVKLFCPNCNDIYVPPSSRFQGVDGASLARFISMCSEINLNHVIRRLLWNDVCTPFLPDLPRARAGTILEGTVGWGFTAVPTQRNGIGEQQGFAVHQS